jgi:hypothetical protein
VPESAADEAGLARCSFDCIGCKPWGLASLALESIDKRCAGNSGVGSDADGMFDGEAYGKPDIADRMKAKAGCEVPVVDVEKLGENCGVVQLSLR